MAMMLILLRPSTHQQHRLGLKFQRQASAAVQSLMQQPVHLQDSLGLRILRQGSAMVPFVLLLLACTAQSSPEEQD